MSIIAKQRDTLLRAHYFKDIEGISPYQFLFLDECSKDNRCTQRMMGHFIPEDRRQPSQMGEFVRRNRISVLAAMDLDGIVAAHCMDGAYDTDKFNFSFEHFFLPHVGNYAQKEPRSVVVLDNCRIHDSDEFIRMVRQKGGIVMYLPPYSPDFNPIEYVFGMLKEWLLRHGTEDIKTSVYLGLETISSADAEAFFHHCGYC